MTLIVLSAWSAIWATISNPIVWIPVALIIISAIVRAIPSDSPAKKWVDLFGTILTTLLNEILKDKSTITDIDGKHLSHDEVKTIEKVKKDRKLRDLFKIKDAE